MLLMRVNSDPSRKDLRVFSVVLPAASGLVGLGVLARPGALLVAGVVAAVGFVVGIVFNGDFARRRQVPGVLFPMLLLAAFAAGREGTLAIPAAAGLGCVGLAGAVVVWVSERAGRALYLGWMSATVPVAWTVSQVCLGAAYYGVLTPIGLLMRAFGRDPMCRRFDRSGESYWVAYSPPDNLERYFRQF